MQKTLIWFRLCVLIESRWFEIRLLMCLDIFTLLSMQKSFTVSKLSISFIFYARSQYFLLYRCVDDDSFVYVCIIANSQVPDKIVRSTDQRHTLFISVSLPVSIWKEMWKNQIREKIKEEIRNKEQRNQLKRIICKSTKQRNAWMRVWIRRKKKKKIQEIPKYLYA